MMKFVGHVLGSCEQIMWMIICQDHVIGKSCGHDITIIFICIYFKKTFK